MDDKLEQEILSMMIESPEFRVYSLARLKPQDFTEANAKIFKAIVELDAKEQNISLDSISITLESQIELRSPSLKKDYQGIVDTLKDKRSEVEILTAIEDFYDAYHDDFAGAKNDLLEKLQTDNSGGFKSVQGNENVMLYDDYTENKKLHTPVGKFGIEKVDFETNGICKQRIYTIISGPGVGKSSIAVQIFEESMKMGTKCLFITTEMTREQLIARMIARITGISPLRFADENLTNAEMEKIAMAEGELGELLEGTGSFITTGVNTSAVAANVIRSSVLVDGVDLIILDHLHNLRGNSDIYSRVSEAAHDIQDAVYKSGVAMVMLAQMNRADRKESNIDMVSSKGSGDVEEVSDVMIAIKRDRINQDKFNDMEIIIVKNRHGATGITHAKMEFPSLIIKPISRGYNVPSLD